MHSIEIRCASLALAIAALLCLVVPPALGDDRPWEQARWTTLSARFFSIGEDYPWDERWFESQIHTRKSPGFEYSRSLDLNLERDFIFSIQGPLVDESASGLAIELRF
jgi:hypothetical protein